tara:strand:- start:11770 stop:12258 length:489 start_codon:yes stop_codon:yes gene_type:complete
MAQKLIIRLIGVSRFAQPKIGEYRWSPEFNAFVWKGRALSLEEFNDEAVKAIDNHSVHYPYSPSVRAVEVEDVIEEAEPETDSDAAEKALIAQAMIEGGEEEEIPPVEVEPEADANAPVSYHHVGNRRYDVYNATGEVVADNISITQAKELCPNFIPNKQSK